MIFKFRDVRVDFNMVMVKRLLVTDLPFRRISVNPGPQRLGRAPNAGLESFRLGNCGIGSSQTEVRLLSFSEKGKCPKPNRLSDLGISETAR